MSHSSASHPRRRRWVDQQRRRRQSPLLRLIDRSFGVRLLLAAAGALLALASVNRWEQCRDQRFTQGCLWHDAGGVVSVDNLEAFSIVTAGFLFILEGGQRRQREHIAAMELILNCQQANVRFSYARNQALELLSEAGIWLDALELSGSLLDELRIPGARWRGVNLAGSSLHHADLRDVDWRDANLEGANLSHCDLRGANLTRANLSGTNLTGANLRGANLSGANLVGAILEGADIANADLSETQRDGTTSAHSLAHPV
jgi:hypothetical protein